MCQAIEEKMPSNKFTFKENPQVSKNSRNIYSSPLSLSPSLFLFLFLSGSVIDGNFWFSLARRRGLHVSEQHMTYECLGLCQWTKITKTILKKSQEPRIGAFEVVLKRPGEKDVLIWSKIQVVRDSLNLPLCQSSSSFSSEVEAEVEKLDLLT